MSITLRELFTPLFAYGLLVARTTAYRERLFREVRGDVERLLEEQRAAVKRHDITAADYENARFAVAAWLDELMLTCTHGSQRDLYDAWQRSPLQVELYDTANAGEEFFDRLERIGKEQTQIVEVYHLCLCLGFRGRYYDDAGEIRLLELRRQYGRRLSDPPLELDELEKTRERVTPQPYEVSPPPRRREPRSPFLVWGGPLVAVAAALLLYWLWPVPPQPAVRAREAIMADVREHIAHFECCELTVVDYAGGAVSLAGRVESESQRTQVRQAATEVAEVKKVAEDLTIVPRPFCEVIAMLTPFRERAEAAGFGLQLRPRKGCDAKYYRNENLILDVAARGPLRNVYVDYYVADRASVAHVWPNAHHSDSSVGNATSLAIGDPGSEPQWEIQPPFGLELLTVVTSPQPLFTKPRMAAEPVTTYLQDLGKVIPGEAASSEVAASYCFIKTEER